MKPHLLKTLFLILTCQCYLFAQTESNDLKIKKFFTVSGGIGMSSYFGDLGSNNISSFNDFKGSYNVGVSKRVGKVLELGLNGQFGKLSHNERNLTENHNFETKYNQFGLDLNIHFDWNNQPFSPYLGSGINYMTFNVHSDLKNQFGNDYHYWSDGVIRSLPEFDVNGVRIEENKFESEELSRDYKYETKIEKTNDGNNINNSSIVIPLRAGFKFQLTEFVETRLGVTYYLTQTDDIDFFRNETNDAYLYANASIGFTVGKREKSKEEQRLKDFDFKALLAEDTDKDGISDDIDQCGLTPKGVKVDVYGCPVDTDEDGIPDFKDKEPTTDRGAVVDENGITLTDEEIYKRKMIRDSIYMKVVERMDSTRLDGGTVKLIDICNGSNIVPGDAFIAIPGPYRFADMDANGILCPEEVYNVIDSYLDGSNEDLTVSRILGVIDFYFEQDVELKLD